MKNKDIRDSAKKAGVRMWQIADRLGIFDSAFSKKLRYELPQAERDKILKIIADIAAENQEAV